jgi:hypothetical protein
MADEESAQAHGDEMVPGDHLRATNDDRDRVVEMLRVAAGDGRLSLEELDQRVGAALTARTYGELAMLVSDMPAAATSPLGMSAVKPKDRVRIDCHSGPQQQREGACAMGFRCGGQVPDRCRRHRRQQQFQGAPATPEVVAVAAAATPARCSPTGPYLTQPTAAPAIRPLLTAPRH